MWSLTLPLRNAVGQLKESTDFLWIEANTCNMLVTQKKLNKHVHEPNTWTLYIDSLQASFPRVLGVEVMYKNGISPCSSSPSCQQTTRELARRLMHAHNCGLLLSASQCTAWLPSMAFKCSLCRRETYNCIKQSIHITLPLFSSLSLKYLLHKLADVLNCLVAFLQTNKAFFDWSLWSRRSTCIVCKVHVLLSILQLFHLGSWLVCKELVTLH